MLGRQLEAARVGGCCERELLREPLGQLDFGVGKRVRVIGG